MLLAMRVAELEKQLAAVEARMRKRNYSEQRIQVRVCRHVQHCHVPCLC